nr:hypothetical protein CTI12_AA475510 [Tanacetum cinerariifolium]
LTLNIGEEQGEDVDNKVYLEEKTTKLDKGQAGLDPSKTLDSRPPPKQPMHDDFVATVYPKVHEILKFLADKQGILEDPLSSSRTLSSMKNLDDTYTFRDPFFNDKSTKDELGKQNVDTKVVSMVTVLIHQASTSVPPLSIPIIDLSPLKSVASLEKKFSDLEQKSQTLDNTTQNLRSNVFTLELRDLPHKINQTIDEVVNETVHVAFQAPLRDHFRELCKADVKEILYQRVFESGSYKSLPEHVALYEVLEASTEWANKDDFLVEKDKSQKRCCDDQDPPPHPPDSDLRMKKRHDSDASGSKQPPALHSSACKTSDTREAPFSSSKQQSAPHSEQPIEDVPIPDDVNISDSDDTDTAHLLKIKTRPNWLKPMEECHWLLTDQVDLVNPEGHQLVPDVSKLLPLGGPPGQITIQPQSFFNKDLEYLISGDTARKIALSISKLKAANYPDFSIKTFERYGYAYLREIVIYRADYNEYKISEADFKILHPNDFKDLYLLHLQGKLNHLSRSNKIYQTKLNLTKPRWDALDFLFKEDYTIVSKPRAVIFRNRNDQKKMLRENKVHKFSDGTLTRVLHKLDHMVKDFRLFKYNPGMEKRIWFEDDKRRIE